MTEQIYSQFSQYFGEQEQHDRTHPYVPNREHIVDTHIDALKNIVIEGLRNLFSKHQGFMYVPRTDGVPGADLSKTKIVITDVYTNEAKFLPIITVRVGSSNTHHVSFNQDVGTKDFLRDENGQLVKNEYNQLVPLYCEYNGAWDSSITLNIFTEDTIDREELVTFTSVVALNLLRDKWRYEGMFVKNVSVGGESEQLFANDYIYNQPVTLDVYSEWTRRIPLPADLIEGFNMSIKKKNIKPEEEDPEVKLLVTPEFSYPISIFYNGLSWQVKVLYKDLLDDRLDLGNTIDLMDELIKKVNDSGTTLLMLPISHNLISFETINIDDFLLLISHTDDSLREDGLLLAKEMDTYIETLTDPGAVAALILSRDRLRNIERTLTGQLEEIDPGSVPKYFLD